MLSIILKQLRKIQFFADWLNFRAAKRESLELSARHRRELEAARASNADKQKLETINGEYHAQSQLIWDPIQARITERLIARARKYGVSVPPLPARYGDHSDDWIVSSATGDWFLTDAAEERLKREVRIERRQSNDEFRKWATLGFAFLAFLLGLVSILKKDKQPDPCAKNYYRGDAGDCVFALKKTVTPGSQQQIAPQATPAPRQQKPPPAHR